MVDEGPPCGFTVDSLLGESNFGSEVGFVGSGVVTYVRAYYSWVCDKHTQARKMSTSEMNSQELKYEHFG